jgi:predicted nucleic acid-binding protein
MNFIDTSVLVAYLCPEALHEHAVRAMSGTSPRLITPLVRVEVASALSLKTRTGEMDAKSARLVVGELSRQIDDGIFILREVGTEDYRQAHDWIMAFNTSLRAADAIHLACAASHGATLLTADKLLAASAKSLGVKCKLIR